MKLLARLGIAVLASLALLGVAPVAAYAGAASIVDNANVLDSGDIETAAGKVDKVNFIVVTLKSSSTNVESDVQSLGTRAGWNGDDWRADSVIIAVNTQSLRSAVFYGVSTPEKIQNASTAEDIRSSMSSDFGNSQWTAGVVAGIEKVQSIVSPSYTWVWFLAVIALLVIGWLVYRSFKSRRAKQEAKLAQDQLAAANQLTAVQLRQRVDELGVLIQTVPDGPTRDPIEAELTDVDVTLRRREERSGFDSTGVGATAEQDQQNLATLQAHVDNITNTLAILRKDPGWQDLWNASVAAARQQTDTLERGQQQVAGIDGFAPMDIAPLKTQLHAMASSVIEGTMPVGDGLAILQSVISALSNKQAEVDARLQAIAREERAKEERERAAQDQRDSDDMSGGLGGGGIGGGWLGGGTGRRRRGGGWGGGFGGGGWGGGGWGGGGRSGGGGFGRRGGGSSGGFGGGGSSGGFGGGGRRGGGSSGGF